MKIDVKDVKNSVVEFSISLTKEEVEVYYDKAFEEDVQKIEEDGFRKGKMPKNVFLGKYGKEALNPTAVDLILNDTYPKVVEENALNVVANPELKWDTLKIGEDGFSIEGEVAVLPEVKLGDYKALKDEVKVKQVRVTKDEIAAEKTKLLEAQATFVIKEDEPAENGDTVVIDFEGFVDGVAFEGGKAENYSLELGSNSFIPGFEEQIVGLKEGEEKDVEVKFPEEYHSEELKGKDSVFKVKVHEIKTKELPELTEEVLAEIEGYDAKTEEALDKEIKAKISEQKQTDNKNKRIIEIFDKVIAEADFTVPQALIDQETNRTLDQFKQQIAAQGMEFEMYTQMLGMTEEALRADIDKESVRKLEEQLIVSEIIKTEKIEATDEEVEAKLEEMSKMYNTDKEELEKLVGGREGLKLEVAYEKAYNELIGE